MHYRRWCLTAPSVGSTTLCFSSARRRNSFHSTLRVSGTANIGIASRGLVASDQQVWCPSLQQVAEETSSPVSFERMRSNAAIASWEKGASRVIDCKAIGGSGGWKRIAQGWAGEKNDHDDRSWQPSQVAASLTILSAKKSRRAQLQATWPALRKDVQASLEGSCIRRSSIGRGALWIFRVIPCKDQDCHKMGPLRTKNGFEPHFMVCESVCEASALASF